MPLAGTIFEVAESVGKIIAIVVTTAFVAGYFACLFCFVVRR